MKKILFTILFCLLTSIGFVGCDVDNNTNLYMPPIAYWYWQPYQINNNGQYGIGGYVAGVPITRAYAIQQSDIIANYDSFSLFMWTKDSVLGNSMFNGILNPQQGTWGYEGNQRFFDNNQPRYSFLGILPKGDYTIKADSTVDVSLEDFVTEGVDINTQKYNKEFIVAKTTVEKQNYSQGATLNFEHQNSIIRIKFETNAGNNLEILDFTPSTTIQEIDGVDMESPFVTISTNYNSTTAYTLPWTSSITHKTYNIMNSQAPSNTWGNVVLTADEIAYINESHSDLNSLRKIWQDRGISIGNTNTANWSLWGENMRILGITEIEPGKYFIETILSDQWNSIVKYKSTTVNGKNGIIVLPATSSNQTGKDAELSVFPEKVTANVGLNGVTYTVNTEEQEIIFTKAGVVNSQGVYSPTNWYTFPIVHAANFGFTIKFSYTLNGVTRYDARVFVPAAKCNWQPGKWYDYVIKVNTTKSGKTDSEYADEDDPKIDEEFPINVNSSVNEYTEGEVHEFTI